MAEEAAELRSQGLRLPATFCKAGHQPPAAVMCHGLTSSQNGDAWPELAALLGARGIASLRFTHRGCGWGAEPRAQGRLEETTLSGRIADLRAALDFLAQAPIDQARIGAVGCSFGGMVALAAQDPRVRALALMATPYRLPMPFPDMPALAPDVARYDLLAVPRAYRRPLLVIHGGDDQVVPVEHAHRLFEAAPEPKRLEIIPWGDHTFTQSRHRNRALEVCVEWMVAHLRDNSLDAYSPTPA